MELTIERAVAGGRMLARHEGRIVFVRGAIPGERVRTRVEKSTRQAIWADTVEVLEPSGDRRVPICEPACGGLAYAHIEYARQCELKRDVVADAFRRLARFDVPADFAVAGSPERGYRLRARLRVSDGRAGFLREGSHTWCDAALTGQLADGAIAAADATIAALGRRAPAVEAVTVIENITGAERVVHFEPREGMRLDDVARTLALPDGVTGITADARGHVATIAGSPTVTDTADQLFGGVSPIGALPAWTRHATSFFQGNRFLTGPLVRHVLDLVSRDAVADLYAGVGLFAIALAARGARVVAIEGDRSSGGDLDANAGPWRERLRVVHAAVEDVGQFIHAGDVGAVVADPPRTGMSPQALTAIVGLGAGQIVYVSCDPPTLARDAAKLFAAGYELTSLRGFDLFPNTAHVESVAVFSK